MKKSPLEELLKDLLEISEMFPEDSDKAWESDKDVQELVIRWKDGKLAVKLGKCNNALETLGVLELARRIISDKMM